MADRTPATYEESKVMREHLRKQGMDDTKFIIYDHGNAARYITSPTTESKQPSVIDKDHRLGGTGNKSNLLHSWGRGRKLTEN